MLKSLETFKNVPYVFYAYCTSFQNYLLQFSCNFVHIECSESNLKDILFFSVLPVLL